MHLLLFLLLYYVYCALLLLYIYAGIVSLIGWLLIFIAQYTETATTFKVFLLLGRFMTGMSTGAFGSIVPVSVIMQESEFSIIIKVMHAINATMI